MLITAGDADQAPPTKTRREYERESWQHCLIVPLPFKSSSPLGPKGPFSSLPSLSLPLAVIALFPFPTSKLDRG